MPVPVPDSLPVLSPGAHRRRSDGGCFMEWASLLAGERWSDHPSCTHPLLAHLARSVNDRVGDARRQRLVPLIPDVIGLRSEDLRWDLEIALVALRRSVPAAQDPDTAGALAAGLITVDRVLGPLDGRTPGTTRPSTARVLAQAPGAAAWAERFLDGLEIPRFAHADIARTAVDQAVAVLGCAPEAEDALVGLLEETIAVCARLAGRQAPVTVGLVASVTR